MTELSNQVQALRGRVAGAKNELKVLNQRALNSISIIRSRIDPLQLNEDEDVTELDIDAAYIEMQELQSTIEKMNKKKEFLTRIERELRGIDK